MTATMNMLAMRLDLSVLHCPASAKRRFNNISLISILKHDPSVIQEEVSVQPNCLTDSSVDKETLYFGSEEDCIDFLRSFPTANALAIGDGRSLLTQSKSIKSRLLLIQSDEPLIVVYERVLQAMSFYNRWTSRMTEALLKGGSYQALIDCSSNVFDDFLSITDSAFRLLAHNGKPPLDDPIALQLLNKGYHPEDVVERFKTSGALKRWETQVGINHIKDSPSVPSPYLSYVFRMQGTYFTHTTLQSTHGSIHTGIIDAFAILIEHLGYCARQEWSVQRHFEAPYEKLLISLITNTTGTPSQLKRQLKQNNIPQTALFFVCCFGFATGTMDYALEYYMWRFISLIPTAYVCVYDDRVVLLTNHSAKTHYDESMLRDQLLHLQELTGGTFGISEPFDNILEAHFAFQQACIALDYGCNELRAHHNRIFPFLNTPTVGPYSFKDFFSTYLFSKGITDHPFVTFCLRQSVVFRIAQSDERNGTSDLHILRVYLLCERRATQAAKILFMHRNSLLYRIDHIQNQYTIDLDDPLERERIFTMMKIVPLLHDSQPFSLS